MNDKTIVVDETEAAAPQVNEQAAVENANEQSSENQSAEGFDFTAINEKYKEALGENALDESSFTDLISNRSKYSDFESQLQSKDDELQSAMEFKTKWESALDTLDPEKITPDKEVMALSKLTEKHQGIDIGVLSKVRNADLDSINSLDGLVMAAKLTTKTNLSDSAIKSEILRGLSIDIDDVDDLSDSEKFRIEREFSKEKGILQEIKDFSPETTNFNLEDEINSRNETNTQNRVKLESHNKEALDILFDNYKETKTTLKNDKGEDVEFKYDIENEFKEKFFDEALKSLTDSGVQITTENAGNISAQIDQAYKTENFNKLLQGAVNQLMTSQKEATHKELHNDSTTNRTEAPIISSKENLPLWETLGKHKQ